MYALAIGDEYAARGSEESAPPGSPPPGPGGACGYIQPRAFKALYGRGSPEFSSGRQQDAFEYLGWLLDGVDRAARREGARWAAAVAAAGGSGGGSGEGGAAQGPTLSPLFSFSLLVRFILCVPSVTAAATLHAS